MNEITKVEKKVDLTIYVGIDGVHDKLLVEYDPPAEENHAMFLLPLESME